MGHGINEFGIGKSEIQIALLPLRRLSALFHEILGESVHSIEQYVP